MMNPKSPSLSGGGVRAMAFHLGVLKFIAGATLKELKRCLQFQTDRPYSCQK